MEIVLGIAFLGLAFAGVALSRSKRPWVSGVMLWPGLGPLLGAAALVACTQTAYPSAHLLPKLGLPLQVLLPRNSLVAGLAATWRAGSEMVGPFSLRSITLMFGALVVLGL